MPPQHFVVVVAVAVIFCCNDSCIVDLWPVGQRPEVAITRIIGSRPPQPFDFQMSYGRKLPTLCHDFRSELTGDFRPKGAQDGNVTQARVVFERNHHK